MESERGYHVEFHNPSIRFRAPVMVASLKAVLTPMENRLRCAGLVEFGGLEAPPSSAPIDLITRGVQRLFPDLTYDRLQTWMGHRPLYHGLAPGNRNYKQQWTCSCRLRSSARRTDGGTEDREMALGNRVGQQTE